MISDPKDKVAISSIVNYVLNQNNQTITIRQGMIRILISLVGGHLLLIFNKKALQDIISKTHIIVKRT